MESNGLIQTDKKRKKKKEKEKGNYIINKIRK
jgi:hypothetical protein